MRLYIAIFIPFLLTVELSAQISEADSLHAIGEKYYSDTKYVRAGEFYIEAADIYLQQKDSTNWVRALLNYGATLRSRGKVREALELYLELDEIQLQQIALPTAVRIKVATGFAYRQLEQYKTAREYYLTGLSLASGSKDSLMIGQLNNNISQTFKNTGDYEKALFHQKKAKEIYEQLNNEYRLSFVLNGIFLTYMDIGLTAQAEPYIRKSLEIRKKLQDQELLDITYHNMGWFFESSGKYDSSIVYYQKSLEITKKLNKPFDITATLFSIGKLYMQSGDAEKSVAYLNEALAINQEIKRPVSIAQNLIALAKVAVETNDLENADAFYNEALETLGEDEIFVVHIDLFSNMGELEMLKGNYKEAEKYLNRAKLLAQKNNLKRSLRHAYILLGNLYLAQGEYPKSITHYQKALENITRMSEYVVPAINLSRAYHEAGSDSAFIIAEAAFEQINMVRSNVAGVTFGAGFFRYSGDFYRRVASWYITQKNNPKKAFELTETAKTRVLIDELAQAREASIADLDEQTIIKRREKVRNIDRLYNEISVENDLNRKKKLKAELRDAEFEYEAFLNQNSFNDAKQLDVTQPELINLKKAQSFLDDHSAIIEYAFSGEGLVSFYITKNNIKATVIDSVEGQSAEQFYTEQVTKLRTQFIEIDSIANIKKVTDKLFHHLLSGFLKGEEHIQHLLLVPEGPLSFLPFEALTVGNQYLAERYTTKYLPSVSTLLFIQDPHRNTNSELLALAGSGLQSDSEPQIRSQINYASLPSALLEVESIAGNFSKADVLKNNALTEGIFKSHNLENYRFLHFATHGIIDLQNASQSGLLLSKASDGESIFMEDGFLNSEEISMLNLNADMVVLSACNTGIGKIISGEGVLGLQRSFLLAGTSSVVVSLWSVFDRSTSVLMADFYKNLFANQEEEYGLWSKSLNWLGLYKHPLFDYKSRALQKAKINMINHPYYSHPVHWAPFILIGK